MEPAKGVIMIDEERQRSWSLWRASEGAGHRVAVASSAEEGLHQAHREKPDAMVLDVRLPGMDGLTAMKELRRVTNDAPIVVITAHGNLSTAVRALEGGAF